MDDAVVDHDVGLDDVGAVHLDTVGEVELELAALQRRRLQAVAQLGAHHLAGDDVELEHAGQGGQVQQLRLGELQGAQGLDEGLRKLLVSDCLTEGRARARARTSLVGANTVNGPGPDRASASLACGQEKASGAREKVH